MYNTNAAQTLIEGFLTTRLVQIRYCKEKKINKRIFNCLLTLYHTNASGHYTSKRSSLPLRGTVNCIDQSRDFNVLVSLGYVVIVRPLATLVKNGKINGRSAPLYDITQSGKELVIGFLEAVDLALKTFKSLSKVQS